MSHISYYTHTAHPDYTRSRVGSHVEISRLCAVIDAIIINPSRIARRSSLEKERMNISWVMSGLQICCSNPSLCKHRPTMNQVGDILLASEHKRERACGVHPSSCKADKVESAFFFTFVPKSIQILAFRVTTNRNYYGPSRIQGLEDNNHQSLGFFSFVCVCTDSIAMKQAYPCLGPSSLSSLSSLPSFLR